MNHLAAIFEVPEPWWKARDTFDQARMELEREEIAPVRYSQSEGLNFNGWLRAPRVQLAHPMSQL